MAESWNGPYLRLLCRAHQRDHGAQVADAHQSLEVYSRLALPDAQHRYDQEITKFPV